MLLPLTFTVLTVSYEDDDRAKALGLLAGVSGVGSTLGPIIGGALTTYGSWRRGFTLQLVGVGVILRGIFEAAMFDAQRAALLLLVLFVLLLLVDRRSSHDRYRGTKRKPTSPNDSKVQHVRRLKRPWRTT